MLGAGTWLLALVLLAAVAAGAVVLRAFDTDMARARAEAARGGHVLNTAAGRIEYAETGSGVPLLSIHGAGGGYDQGLAIAADLVGSGFRVIAPSRFGYLSTSIPSDTSISAQADAHLVLLDTLGIEKVVVVGTSAGARSALELAVRRPERVIALILIVPGTFAPTSPVMVEGSRASRITLHIVNAGADFAWWALGRLAPFVPIRFMGVPPDIVSAATEEEKTRVARLVDSVQPLSLRFQGINIDSVPDLQRLPLEAMKVPTLVISARDDLFNTLPAAEFAAAAIPDARLVVFDSGGHLLVGREAEMRRIVGEFLAKALVAWN